MILDLDQQDVRIAETTPRMRHIIPPNTLVHVGTKCYCGYRLTFGPDDLGPAEAADCTVCIELWKAEGCP